MWKKENKPETKEKREKKSNAEKKDKTPFVERLKKLGVSYKAGFEAMQNCGKAFVWYSIALVIMMGVAGLAVFLGINKGHESVLVPDVVGMDVISAELILQKTELYPRIHARYSDVPGQAGQIISQDPKKGSVVKAGRRIDLVISRGVVFDHVGNYVGTNLDTLKGSLDALYAGAEIRALTIANPIFKQDAAPIGTILEQDPPEGTPISQPIDLKFIVSSGPQKLMVKVPDFTGKTLAEILAVMPTTKLTLDFTQHVATGSEVPGTVVKQVNPSNKEEVGEYAHIQLEFAMPAITEVSESDETPKAVDITNKNEAEATDAALVRDTTNYVHGVFSTKIAEYPYAVPVKLDVIPQEGSRYGLVSFNHIGGNLSIPYAVPHGSVLVLTVLDREVERASIQ
mgnify:CR=1 FL=1